jgi:hypothetical protein
MNFYLIARILGLPVILVIDAARMAQSVAPLALGFARHDPAVRIAGVILNRTGSPRHAATLTRAIAPTGLPVLGTVRLISRDDPRSVDRARPLPFRAVGDRYQILGEDVPASAFVWYRQQAPNWLGDAFDAATAYTAGTVVYYSAAGEYEGDFWTCLATTTAGETPESAAAKWERIEFPAILRPSVAQAALADWVRQDGGPEAARLADAEADKLLFKALHRDGPAQRQTTRSSGA